MKRKVCYHGSESDDFQTCLVKDKSFVSCCLIFQNPFKPPEQSQLVPGGFNGKPETRRGYLSNSSSEAVEVV